MPESDPTGGINIGKAHISKFTMREPRCGLDLLPGRGVDYGIHNDKKY